MTHAGAGRRLRRAVILDRDGVINDNRTHIHVNSVQDFVLFPEAPKAIRLLNEAGFLVFVATNQGGVGLGHLTPEVLDEIHRHMLDQLREAGAVIDDIAVCPHAPRAGCRCRKPKPGMLFDLAARHGFDLESSYMVGDRDTDIAAGQAAGARTVWILRDDADLDPVHSGHRHRPVSGQLPLPLPEPDFRATDLYSAVRWILRDADIEG
ncbi:MAG: HAD family hydrolase [Alicyclobacillaceae bacterium]|nr:HAD family hydrolase [Alicyclobacillaceae bacterium]